MPPPPKKSRLADLQADLEKGFVKPKVLRTEEPPDAPALALPEAMNYPEEGAVVVELPKFGATVMSREGTEHLAPVPHATRGRNVKALAQRWLPQTIERLVMWMQSDDYRASIPAAAMLLDRACGKARQAEPEMEQQAIDMSSMPVRERLQALLAARDNPALPASPGDEDAPRDISTLSPPPSSPPTVAEDDTSEEGDSDDIL